MGRGGPLHQKGRFMGQAEPATIEQQIVAALCRMRGGCGAASTIAGKVKSSVTIVRAALDGMCRRGQMVCVDGGSEEADVFRMVVDGRTIGVLPPRLREQPAARDDGEDSDDQAGDDDPDGSLSFAQVQAEQMWKDRMGEQRWHDDPRALAEVRSNKQFLPFSERR